MIGMTCSRQQHPSTSSLCQTLPTPDWYLESKPRRLLGKKKNLVPAKRKRSKLSYLNGRRVSLDDSGRVLCLPRLESADNTVSSEGCTKTAQDRDRRVTRNAGRGYASQPAWPQPRWKGVQ